MRGRSAFDGDKHDDQSCNHPDVDPSWWLLSALVWRRWRSNNLRIDQWDYVWKDRIPLFIPDLLYSGVDQLAVGTGARSVGIHSAVRQPLPGLREAPKASLAV